MELLELEITFNSIAISGIGLEILGFIVLLVYGKGTITRKEYHQWMKKYTKKHPDWNPQTHKAAIIDIEDYVNNVYSRIASEVPFELATQSHRMRKKGIIMIVSGLFMQIIQIASTGFY